MVRWEPDARGRMLRAAMDLYTERGYEQTTVAEIAASAGVTERTFFRHFADKREVLFAGTEALVDAVVAGVAAAPPAASPLDAVVAGLQQGGRLLEHAHASRRAAVIAANPGLQERELLKLAALSEAAAAALRARGTPPRAAALAAEAAVAVFKAGFDTWVTPPTDRPDEPGPTDRSDLAGHIADALAELRAALAPPTAS